jgi:hypothetical protein
MHLIAEDLRTREETQLGLFESPETADRARAVARLKHQINHRIGRFALRSAATLPLNDFGIYGDRANAYDICDIRGKICF